MKTKKNKQHGRQQRKHQGNRPVVAELSGKTGNDQNGNLGFLPMAVAETSFLVNRLGQDCEPMQFVRELTQNSIEAIVRAGESGQIRWDRIKEIFPSGKSGFKLCITDTGDGMTGEELERHINQLSASGSQQDLSGNFGVGAKISTAPANPIGVVYRSWKHGQGHQVWLHRDPIGQYGLRQFPMGADEYTYHPPVPNDLTPSLIELHGTQVILMGTSEAGDTTKPPEGIVSSLSWIAKYLNSRYFQFPNGVTISVQETADGQAKGKSGNRRLTGQRPYLEDHSIASGTVKIPGAKAHWWILNDDRSLAADSAFIESAGHVAALYQNELYELRSSRAGTSRLQQFGVVFGFRRVVVYVEPRSSNYNQITSNTTRSHLLLNNQPLPWEDWATEFREKMPPVLRKFVEDQGAEACGTDHSQIVHKRIEKVFDLFRAHHYRLNPTGNETVGPGGSKASNRRNANEDKRGHNSGGGSNGKAQQENGKPATKINQLVYPKAVWISAKEKTREPGFLEDRAAVYLPDQNLLQINQDFWVFNDMIEHCAKDIAGYAGAKDMAANTARAWYEQVLTETVIGIRALRNRKEWSDRDVEHALSPEALTAAVMQRYHIATSTKQDLHRKCHVTLLA